MALGVVVADYLVLWDATFALGGAGNPIWRDFNFTLPPGAQLSGAVFSFMLNTLNADEINFRVLVNGSEEFHAHYNVDVFHSVHEVVGRLKSGPNDIRIELGEGNTPIHFGDVILWFQRAI